MPRSHLHSLVSGDGPSCEPVGAEERDALLGPLARFRRLVLAVSGGPDSMALLHLVAGWRDASPGGPGVLVATVDHGIRRGSGDEAAWVRARAEARGLDHRTLHWRGPKPRSGLQDAARSARYDLLSELARAEPGSAILTAHHADDQAETILMRLARGSGVDGLAGIRAATLWKGVPVVRPLLDVPGARLEHTLRSAGHDWLDDPSNRSPVFERVRVRRAMAALSGLGLTGDKAALSARRLARAASALADAADALAATTVDVDDAGYCVIDRARLLAAPEEIALRVLARVLAAVGGGGATVRLKRLEALHARIVECGDTHATLAGCLIRCRREKLSVYREPGRRGLPELTLAPGETALWDGRFEVAVAPWQALPMRVAALGATELRRLTARVEGLHVPPAAAAAALPAFWRGDGLIAVPQMGYMAPDGQSGGPEQPACSSEFTNSAGGRMPAAVLANSLHDPIF